MRRETIKNEIVLRYRFEKELEPLSDDDLYDVVRLLDQHFTYAGIPTTRIPELYLEAMSTHGPYLLKVDDYLRAWERIRPREGAGADLRPMNERGANCSICKGTGRAEVWLPKEGIYIEKECPYHCDFSTALSVRG